MRPQWDSEEAVSRYEAWYATPRGSFALESERLLLSQMLSHWPRRGSSLLEVGCGAGHFLELFWEAGFDVTGLDRSQAMLDAARRRLGHKAALELGNAEYLPFEDNSFEYVALVTALECMDKPETALAEAFRVARRGVVVAFLNRWSLHWVAEHWRGLARKCLPLKCMPERWRPATEEKEKPRYFSPLEMTRLIRAASGRRPGAPRSVLFAPSVLWRGKAGSRNGLRWWSALPFGAMAALRVDLIPVCVTPIILSVGNPASAVQ